jgi:plasmid stabilization system protein ParE
MGQKVIFSPQSLRDLEAVVRYINLHAGSDIATRFGDQLVTKAPSLTTVPERRRIVPEVGLP